MVNRKELAPESSPRAAYGAKVRACRESRGWTQEELAEVLGYSSTHVSAVETGRKPPTLPLSRRLDLAFETVGTAGSFERAWRQLQHAALIEGFPEYVWHEGRATEIRLFGIGGIPGLLQTREYAEAMANGAVERGAITVEQAGGQVRALMDRQAALARLRPPMLFVVMDESCLHQSVGGAQVMASQLQHLLDVAAQPNWITQVAPFSMGAHRPFTLPLTLLTLADRSVAQYTASQTDGHLDRDSASVLPSLTAYHQLQAEAPSPAASVTMINRMRKGMS